MNNSDQQHTGVVRSASASTNDAVSDKWLLILLAIILSGAIVALATSILIYRSQFGGDLALSHSRWGEFGDFLGGTLNPIFALLGLMALLLTIALQSRELRNSTRELANSVRALDEQCASLQLQNFERTFFEMVRLHNDIISDLDLVTNTSKPSTVGRDCFRAFFARLKRYHRFAARKYGGQGRLVIVEHAYSISIRETNIKSDIIFATFIES